MTAIMKTIGTHSFARTAMAEFVAELDAIDASDNCSHVTQFVSDRGVYVIRFEPKVVDGVPVRFDRPEGAE